MGRWTSLGASARKQNHRWRRRGSPLRCAAMARIPAHRLLTRAARKVRKVKRKIQATLCWRLSKPSDIRKVTTGCCAREPAHDSQTIYPAGWNSGYRFLCRHQAPEAAEIIGWPDGEFGRRHYSGALVFGRLGQ